MPSRSAPRVRHLARDRSDPRSELARPNRQHGLTIRDAQSGRRIGVESRLLASVAAGAAVHDRAVTVPRSPASVVWRGAAAARAASRSRRRLYPASTAQAVDVRHVAADGRPGDARLPGSITAAARSRLRRRVAAADGGARAVRPAVRSVRAWTLSAWAQQRVRAAQWHWTGAAKALGQSIDAGIVLDALARLGARTVGAADAGQLVGAGRSTRQRAATLAVRRGHAPSLSRAVGQHRTGHAITVRAGRRL